ncbi:MAG: tRNA pseudouridine(55) synthase TruB [Planctomycetia bacterium]|nr:tRNA pseudouridine(55) synthase TruB [Planctomycetia bacterium]
MGPCGLLNLNKPGGMTSREAVDVVQRLLPRRTKVGHAGTLDPLASGVLVLCVGVATRLIGYVQRMPKRYTGTFLLGRRSPTEDVEGDVTELENPPVPTPEAVAAAAAALVGVIQQRPPAYSAIKVQGRRAYDVARRGGEVELKPRPVAVHRLDVRRYEYPELTLDVECGGGTYVRSLGRDLAESLGTAAVMSGLTRTAVGGFSIDRAVGPGQLDKATLADHVLPAILAVPTLPRVVLSAEETTEIGHGRIIRFRPELPEAPEYAALDAAGRLAAILVPRSTGLGPLHNLPPGD